MTTDHPPVAHHVSLPRPGLAHAAAVGVGAAGADVLVHGLQRRLAHNCLLELETYNLGPRRFHNHEEGPYWGLLLVESSY